MDATSFRDICISTLAIYRKFIKTISASQITLQIFENFWIIMLTLYYTRETIPLIWLGFRININQPAAHSTLQIYENYIN